MGYYTIAVTAGGILQTVLVSKNAVIVGRYATWICKLTALLILVFSLVLDVLNVSSLLYCPGVYAGIYLLMLINISCLVLSLQTNAIELFRIIFDFLIITNLRTTIHHAEDTLFHIIVIVVVVLPVWLKWLVKWIGLERCFIVERSRMAWLMWISLEWHILFVICTAVERLKLIVRLILLGNILWFLRYAECFLTQAPFAITCCLTGTAGVAVCWSGCVKIITIVVWDGFVMIIVIILS